MVAMVKNLPANARGTRDKGLIPGLGRSPGVGNDNPLQKILQAEEPSGIQSMELQRVGHD